MPTTHKVPIRGSRHCAPDDDSPADVDGVDAEDDGPAAEDESTDVVLCADEGPADVLDCADAPEDADAALSAEVPADVAALDAITLLADDAWPASALRDVVRGRHVPSVHCSTAAGQSRSALHTTRQASSTRRCPSGQGCVHPVTTTTPPSHTANQATACRCMEFTP